MRTQLARVAALLLVGGAAACSDGPLPIHQPEPMPGPTPFEYPISMWDERVQGETTLLVHVTAVGDVDSARVHTSSGHEELDSAAVAGAFRMRFAPARQGERRIPMWTRLPVRFSVDSAQARASAAGTR
jgi:TonB family protein